MINKKRLNRLLQHPARVKELSIKNYWQFMDWLLEVKHIEPTKYLKTNYR